MPIYEYACDKCGKINDVLQKVNDPPPKKCNSCGARNSLTKVVSRSSFVLRGGGWYSDLYSSKRPDSESKADPASSPGSKEKKGAAKASESSGTASAASKGESSSSGPPASGSSSSSKK